MEANQEDIGSWNIIKGIRDGWNIANIVNQTTTKYVERCPELHNELASLGVTPEKYGNLIIGSNFSPYGLGYSLAGMAYYITHGKISNIKEKSEESI